MYASFQSYFQKYDRSRWYCSTSYPGMNVLNGAIFEKIFEEELVNQRWDENFLVKYFSPNISLKWRLLKLDLSCWKQWKNHQIPSSILSHTITTQSNIFQNISFKWRSLRYDLSCWKQCKIQTYPSSILSHTIISLTHTRGSGFGF